MGVREVALVGRGLGWIQCARHGRHVGDGGSRPWGAKLLRITLRSAAVRLSILLLRDEFRPPDVRSMVSREPQ